MDVKVSLPQDSILLHRKQSRKREALIDAALTLFLENGFDKTTVDQIAERADISRSTFFRYFGTKEAVAFPYHELYLAKFLEVLQSGKLKGSPFENVLDALYVVCGLFNDDHALHLKCRHIILGSRILIAKTEELNEEWARVIANVLIGIGNITDQEKRKARLTAGAILGLTKAFFQEWFDGECKQDLVKLAKEASTVLADYPVKA